MNKAGIEIQSGGTIIALMQGQELGRAHDRDFWEGSAGFGAYGRPGNAVKVIADNFHAQTR